MASKAGSRIRNIIKRMPTGAITNPNTNERIQLSIAQEVRTENSHWVRPEEVAKGQADALWKVIEHNKDQLKPGTVEISQREAQHNSENDPRDHLTCCLEYKDGTTSTEHYAVPKETERSDNQKNDKNAKKSADKKPEKAGKKK